MQRSITAALALFTTACAGGSASAGGGPAPAQAAAAAAVMQQAARAVAPVSETPRDIDPTGSYSITLAYQGQAIALTLAIGKVEGGDWTGTLTTEGIPTIRLSGVTVKGKTVKASGASPDGAASEIEITINGDDVVGSWKSATEGSPVTGKKIR
ncbi:MAG: hypothetical protein P3A28_03275 [Gemmatimonadota bacterium]|nr:hypothetical protein [Gemmatimonadota bacterium]